jgi:hypothetical protein
VDGERTFPGRVQALDAMQQQPADDGPTVPEWKAVGEVHSWPRTPIYNSVDAASRQMGYALRHSGDPASPPCNPADGSISAEVIFAMLSQRHLFHQGDSPKRLYDAMMLHKQDAERTRFQVVARKPSR